MVRKKNINTPYGFSTKFLASCFFYTYYVEPKLHQNSAQLKTLKFSTEWLQPLLPQNNILDRTLT